MFQKLIAGCANLFSSGAGVTLVLPWMKLLLAAVVAGLAIYQYSNDVNIKRVQTTLELGQAYRTETENARLLIPTKKSFDMRKESARVKCEVLDMPMDCTSLKREEIDTVIQAPFADTEARRAVRLRVNKIKAENFRLDGSTDLKLYTFFNAVRVCTLAGNCDTDTALAIFAKGMTAYLNAVCVFAEATDGTGRRETEILAQFLLEKKVHENIFWSEDKARESLFQCDYLRKLSSKCESPSSPQKGQVVACHPPHQPCDGNSDIAS